MSEHLTARFVDAMLMFDIDPLRLLLTFKNCYNLFQLF